MRWVGRCMVSSLFDLIFFTVSLEPTGKGPDRLTLTAAHEAPAVFKAAILAELGPFSPIYRGKRDNWRGWRLRRDDESGDGDDGAPDDGDGDTI